MATLNFPSNPTIGDIYEFEPYRYTWDGEKWKTIGIGYNPAAKLSPTVRSNIQRLASEAGYNLVSGSFEDGGTVTNITDVLWSQLEGKYYSWSGSIPPVVAAASTPETTGGIGAGAWVDRTDVTLRDEVDKIAVARSLNVTNGNVIYLSDTTTVLDDVLYIYDFIAQEAWRKPSSVGTGETIVSISNGILTTSSGVYNIFKSTHRFVVYARDFGITSSSGPEDNLFDNYNALIEFVNSTGGGVDIVFDNESEIYLNEIIDFTLPIEQIKFVRYIQVPNTRWYFNGSKITCKGDYHKTLSKNARTPQVTLCPIIIWEADNTEIHDVIIDGRSYETTKDASVFPEWPDTQGKYEFRSGQGVCCYCSEKVLLKNISAINHTVDGLFISRFSAGLAYKDIIKPLSGKASKDCSISSCFAEYNSRGGIIITSGYNMVIDECRLENNGKSRAGGYGGVAVKANLNFEFDANIMPPSGLHQTNIIVRRLISKYPGLNHFSGGEPERLTFGALIEDCVFLGAGLVACGIPNTTYSRCEFDDGILRDGVKNGALEVRVTGTNLAGGDNRTLYNFSNCRWYLNTSPFITLNTISTNRNTVDYVKVDSCQFSLIADPLSLPDTAPASQIVSSINSTVVQILMDNTVFNYDPRFLKNNANGGRELGLPLIQLSGLFSTSSRFGHCDFRFHDINGVNKDYFKTNSSAWARIEINPFESYTYVPFMTILSKYYPVESLLSFGGITPALPIPVSKKSYSSRSVEILKSTDVGVTLPAATSIASVAFDIYADAGVNFDIDIKYFKISTKEIGSAKIVGNVGSGNNAIINDYNGTIARNFRYEITGAYNSYSLVIKNINELTFTSIMDSLVITVVSCDDKHVIVRLI